MLAEFFSIIICDILIDLSLFLYSPSLSGIIVHAYPGGRCLGEIRCPERGTVSLLGIHARTKHPAVIRQGARHADQGAVATGEVDAAAERRQLTLPVKEIRQREIFQPYATATTGCPFRQRTEIAERWTECSLFRQPAEADAL